MRQIFYWFTFRVLGIVILLGCNLPLAAQIDTASFASKVNSHLGNNPREKLFLHISKSYFLTGETAWFRIYHYSERDHLPMTMSKVVYVELINSDNESVIQHKIIIDKSGGEGWMYFPTNLSSGKYKIRAYTNWMKNFDKNGFYSQEILIINPFKRLGLHTNPANTNLDLQFFPEGGYLVEGIGSRVGFKATARTGKGQKVSGLVLSASGDTLRFESNRLGIGSFMFTPDANKQYYAQILDPNGSILRFSFPKIETAGYVMQVEFDQDLYRIRISSKQSLNNTTNEVYLAAISRDRFLFIKQIRLSGSSTFIEIPLSKLNEGINQLTFFNNDGLPVCERLVFKYPEDELTIEGQLKKKILKQRSLVEVLLNTNSNGQPTPADLSISVYRSDTTIASNSNDFESYMWLSDLKGNVEEAHYYISGRDKKVEKDLDNLMITQGWRMYDFNDLRETKTDLKPYDFIPEFIDQTVSGTILYEDSKDPVINTLVNLSFPNSYTRFFTTRSNQNGEIVFELNNIYGVNKMLIRPENTEEYVSISIDDPFDNPDSGYHWGPFYLSSATGAFIVDQNTNMQIENIFAESATSTSIGDSLSFYKKPDASYLLDDYTRFPVMEEVMREYVNSVFVRRENGKFIFKVVDKARNEAMEKAPLILLDGVPVDDVDKIMAIDPLKIRKIDVVHSKYFYGYLSYGGIVAYYSYDSDLPDLEFDENTLMTNYKGLQNQKIFFEPKYDSQAERQSRIPDFRNQLYWTPEALTDENGELIIRFYTSDALGTYTIQVHGLSADGLPGSYTRTFEVLAED